MWDLKYWSLSFALVACQLDEQIECTKHEYTHTKLPVDVWQAGRMLQQHKQTKAEISNLINFTSDEGESIVRRVRQQVKVICW